METLKHNKTLQINLQLCDFFSLTADKRYQDDEVIMLSSSIEHPYHNFATVIAEDLSEQGLQSIMEKLQVFYQTHQVEKFAIFTSDPERILNTVDLPHQVNPTFAGLMAELNDIKISSDSPDDIICKQLTSVEQLNDYFHPFVKNFNFNADHEKAIKSYYRNYTEREDFAHFIAYLNEQPIASASVLIKEGLAGLHNLSVLPDYRNRGVGKHLQRLRLNYARQHAADAAVIQAVPASAHMVRQLGFKDVSVITPIVFEVV
jgi:GNAT superfamily N-acetyltransferase